jgi:vitamin B12 transporter
MNKYTILGLMACFSIAFSSAQSLISLDEVVVSDNKLELPRATKTKRVIRLEAEELQRYAGQPLALMLNNLAAIEISGSRGAQGQNLGLYARGGNNRQILILIDGMPLNDPSQPASDFDLRLLDLSTIESIEIIKGPSSVVYGSGAATAVIAITTKKTTEKGLDISLSGSGGTHRSQKSATGINLIQNTLSLRSPALFLELGQQFTNGMSSLSGRPEDDPFNRKHAAVGGQFEIATTTLSAAARINEFEAGFDNTYPLEDADYLSLSRQLTFNISADTEFSKRRKLSVKAQLGQSDREIRSNFNALYGAQSLSLDAYFGNYASPRFSYLIGAYLLSQDTDFESLAESQSIEPYLNLSANLSAKLTLSGGARYINHSSFGSDWVYSLGTAYTTKIAKLSTKLFAELSSAFIAPSLSQLFGPFGPNPDLQPETNTTQSVGIELLGTKRAEYTLSLFSRNENNRVLYSLVDANTFAYQYLNTEEAFTARGAELFISQPLSTSLKSNLSYTFTELDNQEVLRLPKHKLSLLLSADLGNQLEATANYHWVSSRLDTDFTTFETRSLDAYGLIDLSVSKRLSSKAQLSLQLFNALNTDYVEIIGFATRGRNISLVYQVKL